MKKTNRLLLTVLLVALLPAAVLAQDGGSETRGRVEIGGWGASEDGSPDVVAEYLPTDGGPEIWANTDSILHWGVVSFDAKFRDSADQDYALQFDVNRVFRSDTTYKTLLHRLGHQPLDHFETFTNHGRVTHNTDLDPDGEYNIDYKDFQTWNEIQPRGVSNLTVGFGYRDQRRKGMRQNTNVSHCDACHVVSQGRPTNEKTTDAGLDAKWAWNKGHVRGSYVSRKMSDDPSSVSFTYDDALHPELRAPVFDNRVQYDLQSGPQQVDLVPDTNKNIMRLDALFTNIGAFTITAEGVWSETENENANLTSDYNGYLATVSGRLAEKWKLRWRGRTYKMDTPDVLVAPIQQVGIAGPQAGRTYGEIYTNWPQTYLRQSAVNRDVIESDLDVTYRLGKKGGNLRLFWDYTGTDRETFQVAEGSTKSTTNELGLSWTARPVPGLRTNVIYTYGNTDNPFSFVDGQYSTLVSSPVPNPFHPDSAQYFESHDARIALSTADPESWNELELRATYGWNSSMVTGTYSYWSGDNTSGELTDWARSRSAATVTLWSTPAPRWQWYLMYAYNDTDLDTPTSIPLFDG